MTALVFLAAFGLYLAGSSPSIAPRDAADMALAALHLSPSHPPGYPLYVSLGHAWIAGFPLGNPAYRLSVLSALAGAGAVALVFASARRRSGLPGALAAAAILALSAPLWKFSVLQEKYSLHALFVAALIFLSEGGDASFRLSAFLFGLGLVNHQSLLLFAPFLLVAWRSRLSRWPEAVPWLLAGLTPNLFLWIRTGSLSEALSIALRSQYGSGTLSAQLARPFTPEGAFALGSWSLKAWALAVGIPVAAAAAYGAWKSERRRASALLLGALASGPLFVVLSGFDPANWVARSVLEPAFLVPAIATALFAAEAAPVAALALAASFLLPRSPVPERRDDFLAYDYARNLRRAVPPGASLLAGGDTALFAVRWLDAVSPRAEPVEIAGAGLTSRPSGWVEARAKESDVFVSGLPADPALIPRLSPEGLVQRYGAPRHPAPVVLRRSSSWRRDESYARDAKLSYAFAAWSAARLLEARGVRPPEVLDLAAAALDPEDYRLE